MESTIGPFAACAPGLGYREYLAEFDDNAEMWRQIVPGQSGRGLALGTWGLQQYPEFSEDPEPAAYQGDALWVPIHVEWEAVTSLDGALIKPDPAYLEVFHGSEYEGGEDALPVVGITSVTSTWPSLVGPWSAFGPDTNWWEMFEGGYSEQLEMVMPVNHVMPLTEDQDLIAIMETIASIQRHWPMDDCSSSQPDDWMDSFEHQDWRETLELGGHNERCFSKEAAYGGTLEWEYLRCSWDWQEMRCRPCGGSPHIMAVLESFLESLPYEGIAFNPSLIPYWDRLKDRNYRFYESLLRTQETERTKGRSWYYSFSRRWSPWQHSSQVPAQRLL